MTRITILALCLAIYATPLHAWVWGLSTNGTDGMSCGGWQHQRAIRSQFAVNLQAWAMGYLSGRAIDEDILEGTDPQGVFAWIDNYCRLHALDGLPLAVGALVDELTNRARAQK